MDFTRTIDEITINPKGEIVRKTFKPEKYPSITIKSVVISGNTREHGSGSISLSELAFKILTNLALLHDDYDKKTSTFSGKRWYYIKRCGTGINTCYKVEIDVVNE